MKPSIMIVDDDPAIRKTVTLILGKAGHEVMQAQDGHACLAALRGGFHGIILMDIMMPGLSGWQTIRAILKEGLLQRNLVCMLTAMPQPGTEGEGTEEWVFDYLAKPFTCGQLVQMVENTLKFLAS